MSNLLPSPFDYNNEVTFKQYFDINNKQYIEREEVTERLRYTKRKPERKI